MVDEFNMTPPDDVERLRREWRWYRAAHLLIAGEYMWTRMPDQDKAILFGMLDVDSDLRPWLLLNCNDTFAYACADAEDADYESAEKLLEIAKADGWVGLMQWVMQRREERGDEMREPISPVRDMMGERAKLKRRIAELEALVGKESA